MRKTMHNYDGYAYEFGERLTKLLESRGMTATRFADEIGVAVPTITRIIAEDRIPSIQIVISAAKYFKVPTDFLLGLSDEPLASLSEETMKIVRLYNFCSDTDKQIINILLDRNSPDKNMIDVPDELPEEEGKK